MLSRSSSLADGRLRRTKSTSSDRQSQISLHVNDQLGPSGQRQALAAANHAFRQARSKEHLNGARDSSELKNGRPEGMTRSQSQRSPGQGSSTHLHFAAGMIPRRNSNKRLSISSAASGSPLDRTRSLKRTMRTEEPSPRYPPALKENIRATSGASDSVSVAYTERTDRMSLSLNRIRKTRSMYSWGANRQSEDECGMDPLTSPLSNTLSPTPMHDRQANLFAANSMLAKLPEEQEADHIHELEKQRKLRNRASFMFIPFKKRTESKTAVQEIAHERDSVSPSPALDSAPRKASQGSSKKSDSLKHRLKRYFRKSSADTTPQVLPAQHIVARHQHFGNFLTIPGESRQGTRLSPDPFAQSRSQTMHTMHRQSGYRSASPAQSELSMRTKSRVTSWADSTIAGTVTSNGSNRLSRIDEDALSLQRVKTPQPEKRVSSMKNSFFRRLIRTPNTRDASGGSSVAPPIDFDNRDTSLDVVEPIQGSVCDLLPSQRRRSFAAKSSWRQKLTVRAVTPDTRPRAEFGESSTSRPGTSLDNHSTIEGEQNDLFRPRNRLQKKHPTEAQTALPTPDQIANRIERTKNRWKVPLEDDHSLFFPNSSIGPAKERSSRRSTESPHRDSTTTNPDPEIGFTAIREPPSPRGFGALSPSIYSRDTDGQSRSPKDPLDASTNSLTSKKTDDTGTAVIITSHQPVIATYPIGSASPARRGRGHTLKPSQDWRTWLSKEVADLESPPKEPLVIKSEYVANRLEQEHKHVREHAQTVDGEAVTIGSGNQHLQVPQMTYGGNRETRDNDDSPLRVRRQSENNPPQRLRLEEHSPSQMNDRFPMIDTGRPPSLPSSRSNSRPSSRPASRLALNGSDETTPTSRKTSPAPENADPKNQGKISPSNSNMASAQNIEYQHATQSTLTVPYANRLISNNSFASYRVPGPRSQSSLGHYPISPIELPAIQPPATPRKQSYSQKDHSHAVRSAAASARITESTSSTKHTQQPGAMIGNPSPSSSGDPPTHLPTLPRSTANFTTGGTPRSTFRGHLRSQPCASVASMSLSNSSSNAGTANHSLYSLESDLTLLDILRGPYRDMSAAMETSQSSLSVNVGALGPSPARSTAGSLPPSASLNAALGGPPPIPAGAGAAQLGTAPTASKENSPVRTPRHHNLVATPSLLGIYAQLDDKSGSRGSLASHGSRASGASGGQRLAERWLSERERERERERETHSDDGTGRVFL